MTLAMLRLMGEVLAVGEAETAYEVRAIAERSMPRIAQVSKRKPHKQAIEAHLCFSERSCESS
jgi:hypothetical protein